MDAMEEAGGGDGDDSDEDLIYPPGKDSTSRSPGHPSHPFADIWR